LNSLLHRLRAVQDAVLTGLGRHEDEAWTRPEQTPALAQGIGGPAQRVWTVPGQSSFWHAAVHLNKLPPTSRRARPANAARS
jgi:hypothetical protein